MTLPKVNSATMRWVALTVQDYFQHHLQYYQHVYNSSCAKSPYVPAHWRVTVPLRALNHVTKWASPTLPKHSSFYNFPNSFLFLGNATKAQCVPCFWDMSVFMSMCAYTIQLVHICPNKSIQNFLEEIKHAMQVLIICVVLMHKNQRKM